MSEEVKEHEEPVVAKQPKLSTKPSQMKAEDWNAAWVEREIGFHKTDLNNFLDTYVDKLTAERSSLKILVPLCGKSVDMKWLADRGHSVVGVEFVEQAVKEFFTEQNLEYTVEKLEAIQGNVYKTNDDKIHIYQCDMFDFSSSLEGKFDAIWDRAAIVAINVDDRPKYVELIHTLMKPDCRNLIVTMLYDRNEMDGPPQSFLGDDVLAKLFGEDFHCEYVDQADIFNEKWEAKGLTAMEEHLHLITLKS